MNEASPAGIASCPCGSGAALDACCGPHISGAAPPPTAEALMRARYSAFALEAIDFLENTLLPETRGDFDRAAIADWAKKAEWTGLEVRSTEAGGPTDSEGVVEFVAHYRLDGQALVHHETSRFTRRDERWYYVDGHMGTRQRRAAKVGRNDPCPCGSGKKYKKCCGA